MRVVGEVVKLITVTGPKKDADGRIIDWGGRKETDIPGCVIVPRGGHVSQEQDYSLATDEVSVLAPTFLEDVEDGAVLEIQGHEYTVAAPPFHHRSAFGTGRGGTEIRAERKVAT